MPYTLLDEDFDIATLEGGPKNSTLGSYKAEPKLPTTPTTATKIKEKVIPVAAKFLGGIEKIGQTIEEITNAPFTLAGEAISRLTTGKKIKEQPLYKVAKDLSLDKAWYETLDKLDITPPQYFDPKSFPEAILHRTAEATPAAVFGTIGGGLPGFFNAMARTGLGAAFAESAKARGFNDLSQAALQLAGEGIYSAFQKGIFSPARLNSKILYNKIDKMIPNSVTIDGSQSRSSLQEIANEISKDASLNKSTREDLYDLIQSLDNNFAANNEIGIKKLWDMTKDVNKQYRSLRNGKKYVPKLTDVFKSAFASGAEKYPQYAEAISMLPMANDFHRMMYHQPKITQFFDTLANSRFGKATEPFRKLLRKTLVPPLVAETIRAIGTGAERIINRFTYPGARKFINKALDAIADDNVPGLIRYVTQLVEGAQKRTPSYALLPKNFNENELY